MGITDIQIIERDEYDRGDVSLYETKNGYELALDYPLNFKSNTDIHGKIDFGFKIFLNRNFNTIENKNIWHLDVGFSEQANITEFVCVASNCNDVRKYIES